MLALKSFLLQPSTVMNACITMFQEICVRIPAMMLLTAFSVFTFSHSKLLIEFICRRSLYASLPQILGDVRSRGLRGHNPLKYSLIISITVLVVRHSTTQLNSSPSWSSSKKQNCMIMGWHASAWIAFLSPHPTPTYGPYNSVMWEISLN